MKRKYLLITLLIICAVLLCACGDGKNKEDEPVAPPIEAVSVTFDFNDGSDSKTVNVPQGSMIKCPETESREDYVLDGWYAGEEKISFPYAVTADETLKASWTYVDPYFYSRTEDMTVFYGDVEGPVADAKLKKGFIIKYQWYINSTESKEGAKPVEGATSRRFEFKTAAEAGSTVYCFCRVKWESIKTEEDIIADSNVVKLTVGSPRKNILIVGSGTVKNSGSGEKYKHDTTDYLSSLLKAGNSNAIIDTVHYSKNYNIWETGLTGEGQSKIKAAFAEKKYDYVILQMGRDYAITTGSTRDKEIEAYKNIIKLAQDSGQNCRFILWQGPWRQDTSSKYYTRFNTIGITTADGHKGGIREYFNSYVIPVKQDAIVCDIIAGFEKAIESGINPFGDSTNDFPDVKGSYLIACMNYALITGKSPEGLSVTECAFGSISAADAATLQKLAAQVVLGK